ncbi:MAG: cation transporter [Planctomycetes bacterium]|nr:cation transporter [Planctomycetota bacterium]
MVSVETKERGAWFATLGAVFTAVIGSACCWLPLLLIAFGFSAAGAGSFFGEYRPFFVSATFVLLSLAWYLTYRPAIDRAWIRLRGKTLQPTAEACCAGQPSPGASHSCCAPAASRRRWFAMRRFNQVMLWIATAVVIAFTLFPSYAGFLLGDAKSQQAAETTAATVSLKIEGMTCEACAAHLQATLSDVPGVQSASVDYGNGLARVAFDVGARPSREALVKAVESAGYKASTDPRE